MAISKPKTNNVWLHLILLPKFINIIVSSDGRFVYIRFILDTITVVQGITTLGRSRNRINYPLVRMMHVRLSMYSCNEWKPCKFKLKITHIGSDLDIALTYTSPGNPNNRHMINDCCATCMTFGIKPLTEHYSFIMYTGGAWYHTVGPDRL